MATTEVSDIVTMIDFIEEANVYGVQVPGMNCQCLEKIMTFTSLT